MRTEQEIKEFATKVVNRATMITLHLTGQAQIIGLPRVKPDNLTAISLVYLGVQLLAAKTEPQTLRTLVNAVLDTLLPKCEVCGDDDH